MNLVPASALARAEILGGVSALGNNFCSFGKNSSWLVIFAPTPIVSSERERDGQSGAGLVKVGKKKRTGDVE